jgi:hypothetical protein
MITRSGSPVVHTKIGKSQPDDLISSQSALDANQNRLRSIGKASPVLTNQCF